MERTSPATVPKWVGLALSMVLLAAVVSRSIVGARWGIVLGVPLLLLYLALPLDLKMTLLVFGCFFPLSFGNLGPIQTFRWVEWMGPLLFAIMLYRLLAEGKRVIPEGSCWAVSAVLVILLWGVINYVQHPVLAEKLMGVAEQKGGIRSYYLLCTGVCVFFCGLWLGRYGAACDDFWRSTLRALLVLSLILGALRIFSHFLYFDIPFVYGTFRYAGSFSLSQYGGAAERIGGLSDAAIPGIAALLALRVGAKLSFSDAILLICLLFMLFLSGGRSSTVGLLTALSLYTFVLNPKALLRNVALAAVFAAVIWYINESGILSGQINRLFALEGGIQGQDKYRWLAFQLMWKEFLAHPVLGRGIGYYGVGLFDDVQSIAFGQMKGGGHGAYLSILMVWGLGGAYFLGTTLFGSMLVGIRQLLNRTYRSTLSPDQLPATVFVLFIFTVKSFEYVAGGNGYTDMTLYLLAGAMTGIHSQASIPYEDE